MEAMAVLRMLAGVLRRSLRTLRSVQISVTRHGRMRVSTASWSSSYHKVSARRVFRADSFRSGKMDKPWRTYTARATRLRWKRRWRIGYAYRSRELSKSAASRARREPPNAARFYPVRATQARRHGHCGELHIPKET